MNIPEITVSRARLLVEIALPWTMSDDATSPVVRARDLLVSSLDRDTHPDLSDRMLGLRDALNEAPALRSEPTPRTLAQVIEAVEVLGDGKAAAHVAQSYIDQGMTGQARKQRLGRLCSAGVCWWGAEVRYRPDGLDPTTENARDAARRGAS